MRLWILPALLLVCMCAIASGADVSALTGDLRSPDRRVRLAAVEELGAYFWLLSHYEGEGTMWWVVAAFGIGMIVVV